MAKAVAGFLGFYHVALWILGILMHLWTVYILFSFKGIVWAVGSFFFPVISEIYVGFLGWKSTGFTSPYIQWLILLFLLWVGYYIIAFIIGMITDRIERYEA